VNRVQAGRVAKSWIGLLATLGGGDDAGIGINVGTRVLTGSSSHLASAEISTSWSPSLNKANSRNF